jgi:ArsR family transcriptional regulator
MKRTAKLEKLTVQKKAEIFKALGHPTRLRIVEKLADGEQCVCVLLEMFDIDVSTLSRHLSVMKNAEIVSDERRGKNIFYRLRCPCILDMLECMEAILTEQ